MTRPLLRALIIEDNVGDADLLLRELQRGGDEVASARVETAEDLAAALEREPWDVILSDNTLPNFSATAALSLVKAWGGDVPFIIVSGTIGEEAAVAAMRAGAKDFITKGKLTRLLPTIDRELREVAGRVERKQMQEQLLVSDRMASVGTLAAGVAHEINNPLAALLVNLEIGLQDLTTLAGNVGVPNDRFCSHVERIMVSLRDAHEAADRVRVIVRDLKIFSRAEDDRRGPVDVHAVLESSLRMASNEIRHRARLVKNYEDVDPVEANEARLGQVFLNLIINAAQSIAEGDATRQEIRITTRNEVRDRVVVEVRDTGVGISSAVLGRIFDPFFTTKSVGEGTGLGLAICHRIVTSLGGEITVESVEGRGTAFRVVLPAAKTEAVPAVLIPAPSVPRRRGQILVVDDEPMMASALSRLLAVEHDVVAVTAAREAAERIARGERFDVVLCDLMMPEVTGMDLYAQLAVLAPDQAERMVFMTGGAFTLRARQFLDQVHNYRVEKPLDILALNTIIRDHLR